MGSFEFRHGVASGDPGTDCIVLWTRVTPLDSAELEDCQIRWKVWCDDPSVPDRAGTVAASQARDFTVRVELTGLAPGALHRYQFLTGTEESAIGSFRTFEEFPEHVRFAVVCCAKHNSGYFNAYARLAERSDVAFVIHLGDYIYEAANHPPGTQTATAGIGRDFDPGGECRHLADYRLRYAQYRADDDLQRLHAALPIIATVDDHELADNAWADGAEDHHAEIHGPWRDRVAAALSAWEEWIPSSRLPVSDPGPIYRSVRLGNLLTIAILETRTNRSNPAELTLELRTQLGDAQREWLLDLIAGCQTRWIAVAAPSMISPLWSEVEDPEARFALSVLKLNEAGAILPFHDLWDTYAGERQLILAALAAGPALPMVLSGDVHISAQSEVDGPDGNRIAVEWTIGSVTSQNLDDKMGWERRTRSLEYEERLRTCLRHVQWCNLDDHGYLIVDIKRDIVTAEWWFVDTVRCRSTGENLGHSASARADTFHDEHVIDGPT